MTRYKKMVKLESRRRVIEIEIDARQTTATTIDLLMTTTTRAINSHFLAIAARNAINFDDQSQFRLDWRTKEKLLETLAEARSRKYQSLATARNILSAIKHENPLPLPG